MAASRCLLRQRGLDAAEFFRRVELVFPIEDAELRRRMVQDILPAELRDNEDARELQPDGSFSAPVRAAGEETFRAQKFFMAAATARTAPAVVPATPPA